MSRVLCAEMFDLQDIFLSPEAKQFPMEEHGTSNNWTRVEDKRVINLYRALVYTNQAVVITWYFYTKREACISF